MSMKTEPSKDDLDGIEWWNNCNDQERRYWLDRAKSARPVEAWLEYKRSMSERYRHESDADFGL